MLRIYARLLAVVLALIGLAALASILGVGPGAGILYLSSAAIIAYVSFSQRDPDIVRIVVGGMGVLFLLSELFLALMMSVFGFPYEGRGWKVGLGHAALGALTMSCAVLLPSALKMNDLPPPGGDLFSFSPLCFRCSPNFDVGSSRKFACALRRRVVTESVTGKQLRSQAKMIELLAVAEKSGA